LLPQVVSGDSWVSAVSRDIFAAAEEGESDFESKVALFFTSYYLIGSVVLLNVVVAV
jgi:hypothetical protein